MSYDKKDAQHKMIKKIQEEMHLLKSQNAMMISALQRIAKRNCMKIETIRWVASDVLCSVEDRN